MGTLKHLYIHMIAWMVVLWLIYFYVHIAEDHCPNFFYLDYTGKAQTIK